MAVVFLAISCANDIPDSTGPLFAVGNSVYAAADEPILLLEARSRVRDRALSRAGDAVVYWDAESKRIMQRGGALFASPSHGLDAEAVFIQGRLVLSRGFVYTEGSGFSYSLSRWTGRKLDPLLSCSLDLFPSDLLFMEDGRVFLAGVNQAGDESLVYLLDPHKEAVEPLISLERSSTFPRLIFTGDWLLLFHSARNLEVGDLRVYRAPFSGEGVPVFERLAARLPETVSGVFFGYGFALGSVAYIPLADSDRTRAVLPVNVGLPEPYGEPVSGSGGVFLPLGPDTSGSSYWFIAFDPLSQESTRVLTRFDGARFWRHPLP